MCKNWIKLSLLAGLVVSLTGCVEAERKLGRGFNNMTEFTRLGELSRSVEQHTLASGPAVGRTTGFVNGMNRSIGRTVVGAFEVLTFPIPSRPYFKMDGPVYPDSYKPGVGDGPLMNTDHSLSFSGGETGSIFPGSRFKVFE
ncbi:MAG: exosortase system-associated protein, TIGR04073 family [Pedosphaera sp.]|nr:exosortase system-associated protein, TIGR04073 family [Pedosphaera sp.]